MKTQQELIDALTERAEKAEAELDNAQQYAAGLSAGMARAQVDNRGLLDRVVKLEAELAETYKEYHATRDEEDELLS